MKTAKEIYAITDALKPVFQKLLYETEGMSFQIGMAGDGRGWICLYEVEKNVEHQHHVDISSDLESYNWHVNHEFIDNQIEQYHEEIDQLTEELTHGMVV